MATNSNPKSTRRKAKPSRKPDYDVVILGAGIAGSILGAVLARNGASVLLADAGAHPKFAVGESTIPETLVTLRIIAERYGVPEIGALASYNKLTKNVNSSMGIKKHFGFLLHREGQEPNWHESTQLSTPAGLHQTSHLFRQDVDSFLFHTAVRYGCTPKLGFFVSDVDIESDSVCVRGADGTEITARYLVDASGFRSPLAEKLDLREKPSRLKHHARSIFSHMLKVKGDEVLDHRPEQRPLTPWYGGTMHDVFPRGWFWVIPFDNDKRSTNPLVSVGVTMDERLYPKRHDLTPEEEFFELASRYPAVARQFEGAVTAREWVSTERIQYSSHTSVGERWCLMSHAAGFIDPLFSRGISNTAYVINALAWRLLEALRDDQFTLERFEYVQRLEQGLLDHNDGMVNASYISFEHYHFWSAVFRVWAFGSGVAERRLLGALLKYRRTGDDGVLRALEAGQNVGLMWPDHDGFKRIFDAVVANGDLVERGEISGDAAGDHLYGMLQDADFVPSSLGFDDPEKRFIRPTPKVMVSFSKWLLTKAPADVRDAYAGPGVETVKSLVGRKS